MAAPGFRIWFVALICVFLVGNSLGSLTLTMKTFDNIEFCGNLNCRIKESPEDRFFLITSVTIYNISQLDEKFKIATVQKDGNGIEIYQAKTSDVEGAGCINGHEADLSLSLKNPQDCYMGRFLCQLTYIDTDGNSQNILTDVKAANASNDFNNGAFSSQLSKLLRRLDNTSRHLDTLTQNYTKELVALREQNFILHTKFQNVSQELKLIKEQQISVQTALNAITTTEQSKQASRATKCFQGMNSTSTRVKLLLWGQIPVVCDTETDGGGWILIQRRTKGDVDFYRDWQSYKTGFGTLDTDFWLGNNFIQNLTLRGFSELRIDMTFNNTKYYAQYNTFHVDNEKQKYRLTVSGYRGDAGDSLVYHNDMMFSTYDQNNDKSSYYNCATQFHGAWWYNECHHSNLNGAWGVDNETGIIWRSIALSSSLTSTEMKVRQLRLE